MGPSSIGSGSYIFPQKQVGGAKGYTCQIGVPDASRCSAIRHTLKCIRTTLATFFFFDLAHPIALRLFRILGVLSPSASPLMDWEISSVSSPDQTHAWCVNRRGDPLDGRSSDDGQRLAKLVEARNVKSATTEELVVLVKQLVAVHVVHRVVRMHVDIPREAVVVSPEHDLENT